jgi:hypothetical protein
MTNAWKTRGGNPLWWLPDPVTRTDPEPSLIFGIGTGTGTGTRTLYYFIKEPWTGFLVLFRCGTGTEVFEGKRKIEKKM